MTMLTLTTGTAFIMWVGEQITERGIGNGISLIIFAGIVDGIPASGVITYFETNKGNIQPLNPRGDAVGAVVLATVADDRLLRARPAEDSDLLRDGEPSAGTMPTAGRRRTCCSA